MNNAIAAVLLLAVGIILGGNIRAAQVPPYERAQDQCLKRVRVLEKEKRGLREAITVLKVREEFIIGTTLKDLGLDKHYRIIKREVEP